MRNVAPTRALARRTRHFLQLAFFVTTGGGLLIALSLAMNALPLVAPSYSYYGLYLFAANLAFLLGAVAVVIGLSLAVRAAWWQRHPDNDLARIVGNVLAAYLDDRYTLVRNINKSGLNYIDAVLVGPPGVLVLLIVDVNGVFLNEGDRWLSLNREKQWIPARIDPTRGAISDIKSLQAFLPKRGLPADTPMFGAVVFIKDAPLVQITPKAPVMPAAQLSAIYAQLQGNYFARERLSKEAIAALVKLLST